MKKSILNRAATVIGGRWKTWPQIGAAPLRAPAGYQRIYVPALTESGSCWSKLKESGVVLLADDWRQKIRRPLALPPGWQIRKLSTVLQVIEDDQRRTRVRITDLTGVGVSVARAAITLRYEVELQEKGSMVSACVRDIDRNVVIKQTPWNDCSLSGAGTADSLIVGLRGWLDVHKPGWRHPNFER